jgi:hypothetical protein
MLANIFLVAFLGTVAFSWYHGARARANTREGVSLTRDMTEGRKGARGLLWWDVGDRADFTDAGWHHRQAMLVSAVLSVVCLVGWGITVA